eukprot:6185263-Pleurochrysis_carterae.AAC.1
MLARGNQAPAARSSEQTRSEASKDERCHINGVRVQFGTGAREGKERSKVRAPPPHRRPRKDLADRDVGCERVGQRHGVERDTVFRISACTTPLVCSLVCGIATGGHDRSPSTCGSYVSEGIVYGRRKLE